MKSGDQRIKRVGITGAAGNIGGTLCEGLSGKYDLTLFFHNAQPSAAKSFKAVKADLTKEDQVRGIFEGLDAIVHLAAVHRGGPSFPAVIQENILGTYHVLEEARRAGVAKVVFGSTNHVQNAYATGNTLDVAAMEQSFAESGRLVKLSDPPAPDSYYGVSKLCGEDLGRYYALFLRCLQFVAVRIGWAAPKDPAAAPRDKVLRNDAVERHYRALFLSHRDCIDLFLKAIEVDADFLVVYGTSDNPHPIFDLTETEGSLGYCPKDTSREYFEAMMRSQGQRLNSTPKINEE